MKSGQNYVQLNSFTYSKVSLLIRRICSPMSLFLYFRNIIYFVFLTFKDSLFAFSHECTRCNSLFRTCSFLSDFISSQQQYNVVSSAYIKNEILYYHWENHLYKPRIKGDRVLILVALHYRSLSYLTCSLQIEQTVSIFKITCHKINRGTTDAVLLQFFQ